MKKPIVMMLTFLIAAVMSRSAVSCIISGDTNRVSASSCESSVCQNFATASLSLSEKFFSRLERAEWTKDVSDSAEFQLRFSFHIIIR
ncbi:MAG: hypothetical protein E7046_00645 [Lentisphaerae bacterium]|nr:hypothetical protein [Lentisphaerota bacterium]